MDVMIDLETMSTEPNAAIVSIGAAAFDSSGIVSQLYVVIDLKSSTGVLSTDTVLWWMQQDDSARDVFESDNTTESVALTKLAEWLSQWDIRHLRIWGNGSDFDNVILGSAYRRHNQKTPWLYKNNRCYRTLKGLFNIKTNGPVAHNALLDAIAQAEVARSLLFGEVNGTP